MSFCVTSSARKARRKNEREQKKQNKRANKEKNSTKTSKNSSNNNEDPSKESSKRKAVPPNPERSLGKKARRSPSFHSSNDPYANLPPEVAAAMRRDDDEIADLEVKLGLSGGRNSNGKSRLNEEYSKRECFGDDFGSFLDDLDGLVQRVIAPTTTTASNDNDSDSSSDEDTSSSVTENTSDSDTVEKDAAE
jgi:hypothetical protein